MQQVREKVSMLLATNAAVINFEQLCINLQHFAVDVIPLDTKFWRGIRPCVKAAGVCETFQQPIAVHSSGELGIQLTTMMQLRTMLPNLTFSANAQSHQLTGDILVGGKFLNQDGAMGPDSVRLRE